VCVCVCECVCVCWVLDCPAASSLVVTSVCCLPCPCPAWQYTVLITVIYLLAAAMFAYYAYVAAAELHKVSARALHVLRPRHGRLSPFLFQPLPPRF